MLLSELRLENLRNIRHLQFEPGEGFNVLVGANGAGKTSILEGIYLLSHAASFRGGRNDALVRNGSSEATVFGVVDGSQRRVRLGLLQRAGRWTARIDGREASRLADLLSECAVVCFEPGSHALISGPSEGRRRFLDWGVFHVEHEFAAAGSRYRAALRQRNEALRCGGIETELAAWDDELASAAVPVVRLRRAYLDRLVPHLHRLLATYLPDLGIPEARARGGGWIAGAELRAALRDERAADRARGHTTRGPHRADWSIRFADLPRREQLSRGQEKLCAIACTLAQAELFHDDRGEWPIVVLDDLPSELDDARQQMTLSSLRRISQVFISSTTVPHTLQTAGLAYQAFHVEQGMLHTLL